MIEERTEITDEDLAQLAKELVVRLHPLAVGHLRPDPALGPDRISPSSSREDPGRSEIRVTARKPADQGGRSASAPKAQAS
jgi:hypothetical protein